MIHFGKTLLATLGLAVFLSVDVQAGLTTTVEAPGVQTSSAMNTTVIDFDSVATGGYNAPLPFVLPGLTATYTTDTADPFVISGPDVYGGAGGTSNYFLVGTAAATTSATITLSVPQAYFGFWWSAADGDNRLEFYNGGTLVDSFTSASSVIAGLGAAYYGNPNAPFLGQNDGEPYVFINFYSPDDASKFDKIVFLNSKGTGFESDNHTFSETRQDPAVPEPSTMLSAGIALLAVGFRVRAKSRKARVA